jgi:hypothetical protein
LVISIPHHPKLSFNLQKKQHPQKIFSSVPTKKQRAEA